MSNQYEVIIIGTGPAGLGAARSLVEQGVKNVLLLEREEEAGGVPRHCRHPTFGIQTYHRPMNGDSWVARILKVVQGKYSIRTSTTVVSIKPGGEIEISSNQGLEKLWAKRVIIATGVKETPRHTRLVSGLRPQGVLTSGALQQFIYLKKLKPGIYPVIVGSELVSFSTIWTLHHAGIKALALIDDNRRPVAFWPCTLYARLMGVKLYFGSHITKINGDKRVESVEFIDANGAAHILSCDSIIFTGRFTGEYSLIYKSHLAFEPETGRPYFDQYGRCSDTNYYVVGNMTHPADMGDQCYQEGQKVGNYVAHSLNTESVKNITIPILLDDIFRISAPNIISCKESNSARVTLNVRVNTFYTGEIVVSDRKHELYRKKHRCMPERRILLKNIDVSGLAPDSQLNIKMV